MSSDLTSVCVALDSRLGGPPRAIANALVALASSGIKCSVMSIGMSKSAQRHAINDLTYLKDNKVDVTTTKARLTNKYGFGGLLSFVLDMFALDSRVVLFHQVYTVPTIVGGFICALRKIPFVIMPHGSLDPYHEAHHRIRKQVVRRLIINRILRSASAIFVASDHEGRNLKNAGPAPVKVVGLGIHRRANSSDEARETKIIALGRIDAKKRLDLCISAMPRVIAERPDARLVIAGDGDAKLRSILERQVSTLGIQTSVEFTGWLGPQDRDDLLLSGQLLLLPSDNENFAIAVAEGMSMGLIPIVSDKVALAEVISRNKAGVVLASATHAEISREVLSLLSSEIGEIRARVLQTVETELVWEVVRTRWISALESVHSKS